MSLILSLFPGVDLLGMGFELEGFCVLRGPDLIWGGDIRRFTPPRCFTGILGGSPCQDFSKARRAKPTGYGVEMLGEFIRCVTAAAPEWFLLENVPGVPSIQIPGYKVQRFNVRASEFGGKQHRLRSMQFGSRDGAPLVIRRPVTKPIATEAAALASKHGGRSWGKFCALQGLPEDFLSEAPFTKAGKYRAVGNGVFVPMARALAIAIQHRGVTREQVCKCECGRPVKPGTTLATAACRKRMQRKRDSAGVTELGPVTCPICDIRFKANGRGALVLIGSGDWKGMDVIRCPKCLRRERDAAGVTGPGVVTSGLSPVEQLDLV